MATRESHPLAGKRVSLTNGRWANVPAMVTIEDWWTIVNPNAAAKAGATCHVEGNYYRETMYYNLGLNKDEWLYGKVGIIGYIIHASELSETLAEPQVAPGNQGWTRVSSRHPSYDTLWMRKHYKADSVDDSGNVLSDVFVLDAIDFASGRGANIENAVRRVSIEKTNPQWAEIATVLEGLCR